jgi:hypothetical protein
VAITICGPYAVTRFFYPGVIDLSQSWKVRIDFLCLLGALVTLMCPAAFPAGVGSHYVFNRADFPTGNEPSGTAVADFNGDGGQDLVVSNTSDNTISILLGQADGTLGAKTDFSTETAPLGVVVGDFNGDGKIDIAVVGDSNAAGCVSILLGNGDGTFQTHADYATGAGPLGLVVGDFNRDGILDLAVVDSCGPSCGFVSVLLGKGDGTFLAKTDYSVGLAPGAIVEHDFNGDGKPDLGQSQTLRIAFRSCWVTATGLSRHTSTFLRMQHPSELRLATSPETRFPIW